MKSLFDNLARWMKTKQISPRRFVVSAAIAFLVVIVVTSLYFLTLYDGAGDSDLPPYLPDTSYETAIKICFIVIAWPLVVIGMIGGDRLFFALFLPLLIPTAFFWAFVIERIFALNTRKAIGAEKKFSKEVG